MEPTKMTPERLQQICKNISNKSLKARIIRSWYFFRVRFSFRLQRCRIRKIADFGHRWHTELQRNLNIPF